MLLAPPRTHRFVHPGTAVPNGPSHSSPISTVLLPQHRRPAAFAHAAVPAHVHDVVHPNPPSHFLAESNCKNQYRHTSSPHWPPCTPRTCFVSRSPRLPHCRTLANLEQNPPLCRPPSNRGRDPPIHPNHQWQGVSGLQENRRVDVGGRPAPVIYPRIDALSLLGTSIRHAKGARRDRGAIADEIKRMALRRYFHAINRAQRPVLVHTERPLVLRRRRERIVEACQRNAALTTPLCRR